VLPQRPPALALRPAEDPGRRHGIEKARAPIAFTELLPCPLGVNPLHVLVCCFHGCELNIVRHALILRDQQFSYTPILARNSEK